MTNKQFFVIVGICIAAMLCMGVAEYHENQKYTLREVTYMVKNGDSLWSIAERHMDKQDRTDSMRQLMYNISEANRAEMNKYPTLRAGQVLVIPLENHK